MSNFILPQILKSVSSDIQIDNNGSFNYKNFVNSMTYSNNSDMESCRAGLELIAEIEELKTSITNFDYEETKSEIGDVFFHLTKLIIHTNTCITLNKEFENQNLSIDLFSLPVYSFADKLAKFHRSDAIRSPDKKQIDLIYVLEFLDSVANILIVMCKQTVEEPLEETVKKIATNNYLKLTKRHINL